MRSDRHQEAVLAAALAGDILTSKIFSDAAGWRHHGDANTVMTHCLRTAWCAFRICRLFRVSPQHTRAAVRAALVHDLFGYDWDSTGWAHMGLLTRKRLYHAYHHGIESCLAVQGQLNLDRRQRDAIMKHMFPTYPIPPRFCEGWVLTAADKLTAIEELWFSRRLKAGKEPNPPVLLKYAMPAG